MPNLETRNLYSLIHVFSSCENPSVTMLETKLKSEKCSKTFADKDDSQFCELHFTNAKLWLFYDSEDLTPQMDHLSNSPGFH